MIENRVLALWSVESSVKIVAYPFFNCDKVLALPL